jgi:hypothetical protein
MSKAVRFGIAGLLTLGLFGSVAPAASAKDTDVIKEGNCTAGSDWKLKLSEENGQIEVEFEVDQNVVGDVWRVRLLHNGDLFFQGQRTTQAPSGSFEVRRVQPNLAGDDVIRARARNLETGETCTATAKWTLGA